MSRQRSAARLRSRVCPGGVGRPAELGGDEDLAGGVCPPAPGTMLLDASAEAEGSASPSSDDQRLATRTEASRATETRPAPVRSAFECREPGEEWRPCRDGLGESWESRRGRSPLPGRLPPERPGRTPE